VLFVGVGGCVPGSRSAPDDPVGGSSGVHPAPGACPGVGSGGISASEGARKTSACRRITGSVTMTSATSAAGHRQEAMGGEELDEAQRGDGLDHDSADQGCRCAVALANTGDTRGGEALGVVVHDVAVQPSERKFVVRDARRCVSHRLAVLHRRDLHAVRVQPSATRIDRAPGSPQLLEVLASAGMPVTAEEEADRVGHAAMEDLFALQEQRPDTRGRGLYLLLGGGLAPKPFRRWLGRARTEPSPVRPRTTDAGRQRESVPQRSVRVARRK
jgi:hypothetical protein